MESNQGLVETAVRLASLGYKSTSSDEIPMQPLELEANNKLILEFLRANHYDEYREQKAIALITRAYSLKSKVERYTAGIYFIIIAFLRSPTKTKSYLYMKFFG
jgi:hypothetical protein